MEPTSSSKFTVEQLALVEATGSQYAEACPGAGKTRAIVARFLRRASGERRKGIALLSFTNAAVDEVRSRCSQYPAALRAPNFVGTFDAFINRFITTPLYATDTRRTPRFIDSWSAYVRCNDLDPGVTFSLEFFDLDDNDVAHLDDDTRFSGRYKNALAKHASSCRASLEAKATARYKWLTSSGVFSSSASRHFASSRLKKPGDAETLGRLLANRFYEVIVDEAQDCGPEEIAILQTLRSYGVAVVMVADLDQSIYEFRRSSPEEVRKFAAKLPKGARLSGNFRSTKVICAINQSLRFGSESDEAVGENAELTTAVQLLPFEDEGNVSSRLVTVISNNELRIEDAVVLSHKRVDAQVAAGAPKLSDIGQSVVAQVAAASIVLRSSAEPRAIQEAVESIETALLRLLVPGESVGDSLEKACDDHEIERRWLKDTAVRLALSTDPLFKTSGDYARCLRDFIGEVRWPNGKVLTNVSQIIKAVPAAKWDVLANASTGFDLKSATVHSVKGKEFEAAVVVIPSSLVKCPLGKTALDHWEESSDAEVRRVLYVAASRAQKLLVFAVHQKHIERVKAILDKDGVSYQLCSNPEDVAA